jgi:hypothetical protein
MATGAGVVGRDGQSIAHSLAQSHQARTRDVRLPGLVPGPAQPDSTPRTAAPGAGHRAGAPGGVPGTRAFGPATRAPSRAPTRRDPRPARRRGPDPRAAPPCCRWSFDPPRRASLHDRLARNCRHGSDPRPQPPCRRGAFAAGCPAPCSSAGSTAGRRVGVRIRALMGEWVGPAPLARLYPYAVQKAPTPALGQGAKRPRGARSWP